MKGVITIMEGVTTSRTQNKNKIKYSLAIYLIFLYKYLIN